MSENACSLDSPMDQLVAGVTKLVSIAPTTEDFYAQFVALFREATDAEIGLAWHRGASTLEPICRVDRDPGSPAKIPVSQARHDQLLTQAFTGETAMLVTGSRAGSDVEQAVLLGPIHRNGTADRHATTELVEFVMPPGVEMEANQLVLKRLAECCRVAQDFSGGDLERTNPSSDATAPRSFPRLLDGAESLEGSTLAGEPLHSPLTVGQLDEYVRHIHAGLDYPRTVSSVANEMRRLLDCDRVTVLSNRGRRYCAEAISGQASVNRRSNLVTAMETLVAAVLKSRRPLWYPTEEENPPQIEKPLSDYIDLSMSCAIAVIPIFARDQSNEDSQEERQKELEIEAAIVIEQARYPWDRRQLEPLVDVLTQHAGDAIRNVAEIRSVPLYNVWQTVGQARWLVESRRLPNTLVVSLSVLLAILALAFIKVEHRLACEGVLRPARQQRVFAMQNGVVDQLSVPKGGHVKAGQLLVTLQNHDLDIELERLDGELNSLRQRLGGSRSMRIQNRGVTPSEQVNQQEIEARIAGLLLQIETVKRQREELRIESPIDGEVLTWDMQDRLSRRPVSKGDLIVEVGDTSGPWQLRLNLPDRRVGHLLRAMDASVTPLKVDYSLALDPGREFIGEIAETSRATSIDQDGLHTLRVDVDVDEDALADLKHAGSTVSAKIHCGSRSLGYVWLHQVWEFIQYRVLFPIM